MHRVTAVVFVFSSCLAWAQPRTVTLRQAVELALQQNPELRMARLEESKAVEAVRVARDPFDPKVAVGSGLAYSSGFPMSIEGSTPSIIQAQATKYVFNRPQTHLVASAREAARGAAIDTAAKREEIAHQTAVTYLEAERAARTAEYLRRQVDSLARVAEAVRARVSEGRELPLEAKRAELDLARARQRLQAAENERLNAERTLAALLGLDADEPVRVAVEERAGWVLPESEEACAEQAVAGSKELRRLQSALTAKGFELNAEKAAKLPRVDLVAQYSLLSRYNNYEDFFSKFQRHNGQFGVSVQIPLFTGPAVEARTAQAAAEVARLRLQMQAARNRVVNDAKRLYQQVKQAESARDVARLDLDVAREQLSVLLARMDEGRASLREVEQARMAEDEKWVAFLEANYTLEAARLDLLKQTGDLLAALR